MAKSKKTDTRAEFTFKKIACLVMAVVLFSAAVSIILTGTFGNNKAAYYIRGIFIPDGVVQNGSLQIEGIEPTGPIPQGEIRYYINKEVAILNGYALADVMIQNPEKCAYVLQFRYYLADGTTNIPIYTSPMIEPGQYLENDKLDQYLDLGEYECTYTVTAYEPDNLTEPYGTSSGLLTVYVG